MNMNDGVNTDEEKLIVVIAPLPLPNDDAGALSGTNQSLHRSPHDWQAAVHTASVSF